MPIAITDAQIKKATIFVAKRNYLLFFKFVLGADMEEFHLEWLGWLQNRYVNILAPRDHGKSHFFTVGYAIWNAYYKRHKSIYIFSASERQAGKMLARIKDEIEERPDLLWLKPLKLEQWNRLSIKLSNGVEIHAQAINSRTRGPRAGLIILDDILDEKNCATKDMRETMDNVVLEKILPMLNKDFKDRQFIVVGTPQHYKDTHHTLLANPLFKGKKYKAIIDENNKIVLSPRRRPYERLMEEKAAMGSVLRFTKEYQCEPVDESSTIFQMKLLGMAKDINSIAPLSYNGTGIWRTFMGVDFSVPNVTKNWTVICVIGVDNVGRITLLNLHWSRGHNFTAQMAIVEDACTRFNVSLGFLEANAFQGIYADTINDNTALPLRKYVTTGKNKNDQTWGLLGLENMFITRKILLPYHPDDARGKAMTDRLCLELNQLRLVDGKVKSAGEHDDCVMAFWLALCAARSGIITAGASSMQTNPFFRRGMEPGSGRGQIGNIEGNRGWKKS